MKKRRRYVHVPPDLTSLFVVLFILIFAALIRTAAVTQAMAQAAAPTPKTGWSAAEIANIDKLLRNGLGINAERGDQLVVSAMNFPAKAD